MMPALYDRGLRGLAMGRVHLWYGSLLRACLRLDRLVLFMEAGYFAIAQKSAHAEGISGLER